MNTVRKGNYYENKVKAELETQLYLVDKPNRRSKHFGSIDFFNLWDLIAVRSDDIKFVQVCSRMKPKEWVARAQAFRVPSSCSKEIWIYKRGASNYKKVFLD